MLNIMEHSPVIPSVVKLDRKLGETTPDHCK